MSAAKVVEDEVFQELAVASVEVPSEALLGAVLQNDQNRYGPIRLHEITREQVCVDYASQNAHVEKILEKIVQARL